MYVRLDRWMDVWMNGGLNEGMCCMHVHVGLYIYKNVMMNDNTAFSESIFFHPVFHKMLVNHFFSLFSWQWIMLENVNSISNANIVTSFIRKNCFTFLMTLVFMSRPANMKPSCSENRVRNGYWAHIILRYNYIILVFAVIWWDY